MKKAGHDVIGGGAIGDGFDEKFKKLEVPFVALPVDKKATRPISDLKLFWTLYKWYQDESPDIVHHFTIKPVIYGSIAARLAGVPTVINTVTGLGYPFADGTRFALRLIVKILYRFSLGCSTLTFFLNKDDMNYFIEEKIVRRDKAEVLNSEGVDCEYFTNSTQRSAKPKKPKTFLILCRLIKEKGVYEFVEAARKVKMQFKETRFQIAGERDERNPSAISLVDLEQWQSEGIIDWLGKVSDVRPIIANADVVVLPSYYREGIPRCLLEGAAMGKALISTDSIGCRETIQEGVNGLLIPPRDADALAQAMIKMIESPEMTTRMGLAGREKMKLEFDEKFVIHQILKAYSA